MNSFFWADGSALCILAGWRIINYFEVMALPLERNQCTLKLMEKGICQALSLKIYYKLISATRQCFGWSYKGSRRTSCHILLIRKKNSKSGGPQGIPLGDLWALAYKDNDIHYNIPMMTCSPLTKSYSPTWSKPVFKEHHKTTTAHYTDSKTMLPSHISLHHFHITFCNYINRNLWITWCEMNRIYQKSMELS